MSESTPLLGGVARSRMLWRSGALLVAAGIITGAFGAHALKSRQGVTTDNVHAWETASHYAMINGLGMMLVSVHPRFALHRFAGPAIGIGSVLFSGSIMALVLGGSSLKFLGPVTPMGGLVMIAGYLSLAL